MSENYDPATPLKADATNEQVMARYESTNTSPSMSDSRSVVKVARELAAASVVACERNHDWVSGAVYNAVVKERNAFQDQCIRLKQERAAPPRANDMSQKTAWSIIRDAMVQAARVERSGCSNEERSARFDGIAAQAEGQVKALNCGGRPMPDTSDLVARAVFREGFLLGWKHRDLVTSGRRLGFEWAAKEADAYVAEHPDMPGLLARSTATAQENGRKPVSFRVPCICGHEFDQHRVGPAYPQGGCLRCTCGAFLEVPPLSGRSPSDPPTPLGYVVLYGNVPMKFERSKQSAEEWSSDMSSYRVEPFYLSPSLPPSPDRTTAL